MFLRRAATCAALCMPLLASAAEWDLRLDGIGPLTVGMRFKDANAQLHGTLELDPGSQSACYYARAPGHPQLALMFVSDVLRRVDVMEGGVRTAEGVAVGDPVKHVFDAYRRVAAERHAYDEREQYLTVRSPDGRLALRFETREGRISAFYAGRYKEVQYIEGCL
jgi:hypothetical protein